MTRTECLWTNIIRIVWKTVMRNLPMRFWEFKRVKMIPNTPLLRQHASLVRIFFIYCPVPQALFSGLLYVWNLWNPVLIWSTDLWLIWDFEFDLIESVFSARLLCLLTFGPVGRGRNWITYSGRGRGLKHQLRPTVWKWMK